MILFYLTIWIDGIIACVRSKIDESYQQGSNPLKNQKIYFDLI
jgi:hypothetical protein